MYVFIYLNYTQFANHVVMMYSPDIFSIWGYSKDRVYNSFPSSAEYFKA